jgi:hypothetical protein
MVLAMTHEEIVAGLVAREVNSYQQLPRLVFQIQTKFRDDARPRAGLIRAREFTMKDAYSLDVDEEGLEAVPGDPQRVLRNRRPLRLARGFRGRGRRHHGREPGPRAHVPLARQGGHHPPLRPVRLYGQPLGAQFRKPSADPEEPPRYVAGGSHLEDAHDRGAYPAAGDTEVRYC